MNDLKASLPPSWGASGWFDASQAVIHLHLLELVLGPLVHGDGADERNVDPEACQSDTAGSNSGY